MSNIRFEFVIEAPVESVYRAITKVDGIQGWWTKDVSLEAKENSAARFGFGDHGEMKFTIAKLEANAHVRWNTVSAPPPDWQGTHVTFDLEAVENGTKLNFAHRNFATEDGSFANVSFQWAFFMGSLKSYVETGQGMPTMV